MDTKRGMELADTGTADAITTINENTTAKTEEAASAETDNKEDENEHPFYARFYEALSGSGMKASELARRAGVEKSSITRYLQGQYLPKIDAVVRMANVLGVSEMWLMGVDQIKEPIKKKGKDQNDILDLVREHFDDLTADALELFYELDKVNQGRIIDRMEIMITNPGSRDLRAAKAHSKLSRSIPVYSAFSSRAKAFLDDDSKEFISIPDSKENKRVAYAVRVTTNDFKPLYNKEDILLIEPSYSLRNGDVGLFNINGCGYLKRMKNDAPEAVGANSPGTSCIACIGRVAGVLKQ